MQCPHCRATLTVPEPGYEFDSPAPPALETPAAKIPVERMMTKAHAELMEDEAKRTHERRLNGKDAWRMADAPEDYMQQMLGNIVAFRVKVQRLLAKSKLSQNREARDYAGAISGLKASGNDALAEIMDKRRPKTE